MNLEILLSWIMGFIVFAAILLTIHEFIQFKLKNVLSDKRQDTKHPTEGQFFRLFIPSQRSAYYEKLKQESNGITTKKQKYIRYAISLSFVLIFLVVSTNFVQSQQHKLYPPMDLGQEDIKDIDVTPHSFNFRNLLPAQAEIQSNKVYVLIKSDLNKLAEDAKSIVQAEFEAAEKWVKKHNLKFKNCHWERIRNCNLSLEKNVLVILTSNWDENSINSWLEQSYSVLMSGVPLSIILNEGEKKEFLGLNFENFRHFPERRFGARLAADRELTLGIPAGTGIEVLRPRYHYNYRVRSENSQAIGVNPVIIKSQYSESTLVSGLSGEGRWVWTDLLNFYNTEEVGLALTHNIVGYLEKQSKSTIAHWPKGKKFAAILEQDTEDQFHNSADVADIFARHEFPITWFILSELAEAHRSLLDKMADVGEIACHGDNHNVFPDGSLYRQSYRLLKCQKTLAQLTDQSPTGFRPPEEKFNTDTLSATLNSGYDYIFAAYDFINAVPRIAVSRKNTSQELLVYPRMNHDDYALWVTESAPANKSMEILKEDVDFSEALGGLYTFSFHTQYMGDKENLGVVEDLVKYLKTKDVYAVTGVELASWWKFRDQLATAEYVDPELLKLYQPQRVTLEESGKLSITDYQ